MIISAMESSFGLFGVVESGGCIVLSYAVLLQVIAWFWLARQTVTALQRYSAVRDTPHPRKINYTIYLYIYKYIV